MGFQTYVPQRMSGNFIIEVQDDEEVEDEQEEAKPKPFWFFPGTISTAKNPAWLGEEPEALQRLASG